MWGSCPLDRSLPYPQVTSLQNKANFPFYQTCLFIGFSVVSSWTPTFVHSFLAPSVRLCSHDIWLPGVFLNRATGHDKSLGWLWWASCSWLAVPERGIWGDIPSSCWNHLFWRSSLFLPCPALAANLRFSLVERKHEWAFYQLGQMCVYRWGLFVSMKHHFQLVLTCVWRWGSFVLGKRLLGSVSVILLEDLWQFCLLMCECVLHLYDWYLCCLL